jgi:hypothetical protein
MTEPTEKRPDAATPAARDHKTIIWAATTVLVAVIMVGGMLLLQRGCQTGNQTVYVPRQPQMEAPNKDARSIPEKIADRIEGMAAKEKKYIDDKIAHAEKLAGAVYDKLKGAVKPVETARAGVTSQFARVSSSPQLVVMKDAVDVDITRSNERLILWGRLNLGKTEVELKARGNKVQFYVPMSQLKADDFSYDPDARRVVVRVPEPVLDRELVEVQSNPADIEVRRDAGWARLSALSGKALEREAREALRDEVLTAADTPERRAAARTEAAKALRPFFSDLANSLQEGVQLDFEFVPAAPAAKASSGS